MTRTVALQPLRIRCEAAILTALKRLGGAGTRTEITCLAREAGDFTERERTQPAPLSKPQYASNLDYSLSWAITSLKGAGAINNPRRGWWVLEIS